MRLSRPRRQHAALLAFPQAVEHVLQRRVGCEHLKAVLHQAHEALAVGGDLVVRREGVQKLAERAAAERHAQQLHVDALELVDLQVRLLSDKV